jgi:chromosome segregation ATPase
MDVRPYTPEEIADIRRAIAKWEPHLRDAELPASRWLATLDSYQDHIARLKHEVGEYTDKLAEMTRERNEARAELAALKASRSVV